MARAIVKLEIQWDTDKCSYKTSGAALYRDLSDFFAAHGKSIDSIDVIGDAGVKVLEITDMEGSLDPKQLMTKPTEMKPMKDQFKNLKMPTGKKVKK